MTENSFFKNKIVLVAISERGTGKTITLKFSQNGAIIIFYYIHNQNPVE